MNSTIFCGGIPALMTPCGEDRAPNTAALIRKAQELMGAGMNAVVYCGSMGDWPLLTDVQRQASVAALTEAGVPVIVGTGAVNTRTAAAHAAHAQDIGARGLMVIPRLLSRGTSPAAQRKHFAAILGAAPELPAVIYNSPYYGFETKADLFFDLQGEFSNLVGFKEFGGAEALSYAAEHITSRDENLVLMAGVDTQVFHGFVNCGARGAITGIGNCLPVEVLHYLKLCERAVTGCARSRAFARELEQALQVLSTFDEGPDLVLYYKHLIVVLGDSDYEHHFNETDKLSESQRKYVEAQLKVFQNWWANWEGRK